MQAGDALLSREHSRGRPTQGESYHQPHAGPPKRGGWSRRRRRAILEATRPSRGDLVRENATALATRPAKPRRDGHFELLMAFILIRFAEGERV